MYRPTYRAWLSRALLGTLGPAALAWGHPAIAQTAPPYAQLFHETENAPRRAVLRAEIERAQGLARQATARPNPSVSLLTENIAGDRSYGGFDRAESTVQFNQPIELGGKRSARIAAGEAGVAASRAEGRQGLLNYAYDLALAYGTAEVTERRIALVDDQIAAAEQDLHAARALFEAGKETRLRALQAEAEVSALRAERDRARADNVGAYARLAAFAGQEQTYSALAESLLDRVAAPPSIGPIDPLLTSSYQTAEAQRVEAARRATVEERRAIPDVTASLGVRRLEQDRANAIVAGIALPFPLFDRNRGNIAAAQAEVRAAEARAAAARLEAEAEIRAATAQVEANEARVAATATSLATAQETYRLARIAYEAGKSPLIELIAARRNVGLAQGIALSAAADRLSARAALARLEGRTLTGEPIP